MDHARLMQLTNKLAADPGISDVVRKFIAEAFWKRATADSWPELFGAMTQREVDAMSLDEMEKRIHHHILYSDGTSTPRGLTSPRSPRLRSAGR